MALVEVSSGRLEWDVGIVKMMNFGYSAITANEGTNVILNGVIFEHITLTTSSLITLIECNTIIMRCVFLNVKLINGNGSTMNIKFTTSISLQIMGL
jgi:hypothetical protein